jgi:hypothetical protein
MRQAIWSSSIWGNFSKARETYAKAGPGTVERFAMERNSFTVALRFSVLVNVTGNVEVTRLYSCSTALVSIACKLDWLRTSVTSNHLTAAYSTHAVREIAPAATTPRCNCQMRNPLRSSLLANWSFGAFFATRCRYNCSAPMSGAPFMPTSRAASGRSTALNVSRPSEGSDCWKSSRWPAGVMTIAVTGGPSFGRTRRLDKYW